MLTCPVCRSPKVVCDTYEDGYRRVHTLHCEECLHAVAIEDLVRDAAAAAEKGRKADECRKSCTG